MFARCSSSLISANVSPVGSRRRVREATGAVVAAVAPPAAAVVVGVVASSTVVAFCFAAADLHERHTNSAEIFWALSPVRVSLCNEPETYSVSFVALESGSSGCLRKRWKQMVKCCTEARAHLHLTQSK